MLTNEAAGRGLQKRILEDIVLAPHIGVRVVERDAHGLVLSAPLEANSNHHGTAFGGSLYSLAALAGWGLLTLELEARGIEAELVIQDSRIDFVSPVDADFTARARTPDSALLDRCVRTLERYGRSRIAISVVIECRGSEAVRFSGTYAIASDGSSGADR
jgi:thioesterase domain-containing protein